MNMRHSTVISSSCRWPLYDAQGEHKGRGLRANSPLPTRHGHKKRRGLRTEINVDVHSYTNDENTGMYLAYKQRRGQPGTILLPHVYPV